MVSYSFGSCNLFKNMYWIFGDGTNINIWHDIWFLGGPLRKLLEGPLQYREENNKVTTLRQSLNWDFDSLSMPIQEQIKSIIQGISVSLFQNTLDKLVWLENNGFYSVKSTFQSTYNPKSESTQANQWKWIWQISCPKNNSNFHLESPS